MSLENVSLAKKLKSVKTKKKRSKPVWRGPEKDGITQSLLSRFLVCRERFRLLVVEGLCPAPHFNHRMEYGSMWHLCEETIANRDPNVCNNPDFLWQSLLQKHCKELCKTYPTEQQQIEKWYRVCVEQFQVYADLPKKFFGSIKKRTTLLTEQVFCVPYTLPSGRVVLLRGKWDRVFLESRELWLDEHKTKADINEEQVQRQHQFDLQTMFYLVALQLELAQEKRDGFPKAPLAGVNYNVVRRPLSGSKGSIRPHKGTKNKLAETNKEFYDRLAGIIAAEPEYYFMRWRVYISQADIERFKKEFLNPILEQLCDWWDWITIGSNPNSVCRLGAENESLHWRTPFGFYNVLAESGSTELDEYLANGSEAGLVRTNKLFKELE